MDSHWKNILALIIASLMMVSCITTTVVEEIDGTVESNEAKSTSNDIRYGKLVLRLYNDANNSSLWIDSIEICNILLEDRTTGGLKLGNITLFKSLGNTHLEFGNMMRTTEMHFPEQTFAPWSPYTLPENSDNMYLTIHGQLYACMPGNNLFTIYSGAMYFTFSGSIKAGDTTNIEFELYDNCPLYCKINGKMETVLNSININVTVNDWEEN